MHQGDTWHHMFVVVSDLSASCCQAVMEAHRWTQNLKEPMKKPRWQKKDSRKTDLYLCRGAPSPLFSLSGCLFCLHKWVTLPYSGDLFFIYLSQTLPQAPAPRTLCFEFLSHFIPLLFSLCNLCIVDFVAVFLFRLRKSNRL